jgi:hypothetical protein
MNKYAKYVLIGALIGFGAFLAYLILGNIFYHVIIKDPYAINASHQYSYPSWIRYSYEFFYIFNLFFFWVWFLLGGLIGLLICKIKLNKENSLNKLTYQKNSKKIAEESDKKFQKIWYIPIGLFILGVIFLIGGMIINPVAGIWGGALYAIIIGFFAFYSLIGILIWGYQRVRPIYISYLVGLIVTLIVSAIFTKILIASQRGVNTEGFEILFLIIGISIISWIISLLSILIGSIISYIKYKGNAVLVLMIISTSLIIISAILIFCVSLLGNF